MDLRCDFGNLELILVYRAQSALSNSTSEAFRWRANCSPRLFAGLEETKELRIEPEIACFREVPSYSDEDHATI